MKMTLKTERRVDTYIPTRENNNGCDTGDNVIDFEKWVDREFD